MRFYLAQINIKEDHIYGWKIFLMRKIGLLSVRSVVFRRAMEMVLTSLCTLTIRFGQGTSCLFNSTARCTRRTLCTLIKTIIHDLSSVFGLIHRRGLEQASAIQVNTVHYPMHVRKSWCIHKKAEGGLDAHTLAIRPVHLMLWNLSLQRMPRVLGPKGSCSRVISRAWHRTEK